MSFLPENPKKGRLLLFDGHSLIYRSFYAISKLQNSDGFPTNAIYGFVRTVFKILNEWPSQYGALTLDSRGETIRHKSYKDYKANRPEMPDELASQIPKIVEITESMGMEVIQKEGYEADDIIATLTSCFTDGEMEILIVSNDKDLMQLVSEDVHMLVPSNKEDEIQEYDPQRVKDKLGVKPGRVVDLLALKGDTSDNIPGVPQIGEVRSKKLLQEYGDLDTILESATEINSRQIRRNLLEYRDDAITSRKLIRLHGDLDLSSSRSDLRLESPNIPKLRELFLELEFSSLLEELPSDSCPLEVEIVEGKGELEDLLDEIRDEGAISLDLETDHRDPVRANPVGISISLGEGSGYYIPINHISTGLAEDQVLGFLKPVFENDSVAKIGQNLKYDAIVLKNSGIDLRGIQFDSMIASYLLKPGKRRHNLKEIAKMYLDRDVGKYDELSFPDEEEGFRSLPVEEAASYAVTDAEVIWPLKDFLGEKLERNQQMELLTGLEIPLLTVLRDMELAGIKFLPERLQRASDILRSQLSKLQEEINDLAGGTCNPNSPKQVRQVLFDDLGLPVIERTKTGPSTNARVLEQLSDRHPLPEKILHYRELDKLLNTYVDKLPDYLNPETGRIHTSFNQTATATGRLSSSDPNLQNIPKGTEQGEALRRAFVPSEGHKLIGADYSQIELRLLAHLSEDPVLMEVFEGGEDLHQKTAARIFDVEPGEVTSGMRDRAKRVNFGIVYGITDYGLARDLGIERKEAAQYKKRFFDLYPKTKVYMEELVDFVRDKGYAKTYLNRRRYLPDINSRDWNRRNHARRNAINMPIQGGAADLMKEAMLEVSSALNGGRLVARMLLQVHDELILESPVKEAEQVAEEVKTLMENVRDLSVPLKVDVEVGEKWSDL